MHSNSSAVEKGQVGRGSCLRWGNKTAPAASLSKSSPQNPGGSNGCVHVMSSKRLLFVMRPVFIHPVTDWGERLKCSATCRCVKPAFFDHRANLFPQSLFLRKHCLSLTTRRPSRSGRTLPRPRVHQNPIRAKPYYWVSCSAFLSMRHIASFRGFGEFSLRTLLYPVRTCADEFLP